MVKSDESIIDYGTEETPKHREDDGHPEPGVVSVAKKRELREL